MHREKPLRTSSLPLSATIANVSLVSYLSNRCRWMSDLLPFLVSSQQKATSTGHTMVSPVLLVDVVHRA